MEREIVLNYKNGKYYFKSADGKFKTFFNKQFDGIKNVGTSIVNKESMKDVGNFLVGATGTTLVMTFYYLLFKYFAIYIIILGGVGGGASYAKVQKNMRKEKGR